MFLYRKDVGRVFWGRLVGPFDAKRPIAGVSFMDGIALFLPTSNYIGSLRAIFSISGVPGQSPYRKRILDIWHHGVMVDGGTCDSCLSNSGL